jgi:uncharacterized protein (DUF2345 family)
MTLKSDVAAIRDQLTPLQGARVTDPHLAQAVETDDSAAAPSVANPTAGPHRYTILVPHDDKAVLNVGQGMADANHINDIGITGRTKSHIHWHTTEGTGKSMIAIGGMTNEGWPGFKSVLGSMSGYTMQTEGGAYNDAALQFYIVSRTGEVVLRAHTENVRIQADAKSVEIGANEEVVIGAKKTINIVSDSGAKLDDNGYKQHFDGAYNQGMGSKSQKILLNALDAIASFQGICTAFSSLDTIGADGKWGWTSEPNSVAKFYVDVGKLISTLGRMANGLHAPGQVKVSGENYASLTGGLAASVFGNLSASVSSVVSASLLGGTASVKGLAWTSLWAGLGVSMKTLGGKAEVKSEHGKAAISAKSDIAIASKDKAVKITGKTGAQLNANAGPLTLHGKTAYIGGGEGAGYGMIASTDTLQIGKLGSPKEFKSPGFDEKHGMTMSADQIMMKHGNTVFLMSKNYIAIQCKQMYGWKIDSDGKIQADGDKILFG